MSYSILTESIILITWGLTPWYTYLLFYQGQRSHKKAVLFSLFVLLWSLFGFNAAKYQFDALPGLIGDARPLLYLLFFLIITWLFRWKIVGNGLSQHLLVALQIFRSIGGLFLLEHYYGHLPAVFAYPAGLGDILVGVLATYATIKFNRKDIPDQWVKIIVILGSIDFISAFFFGFFSSPSPLQLFSIEQPNTVIEYPTGIIPLFLVPFAFCAHILSWTEMKRRHLKKPHGELCT